MEWLYRLILKLYRLAISVSSFFNPKARLWIQGRKNWRRKLRSGIEKKPGNYVWIHASSVGEFEQGRPILELIRKQYPEFRILLTFFSPSGFEQFKNYEQADMVFYLPLDSPRNANAFIKIVQPKLAVFVKYEFWYFYFKTLRLADIPFVLISAKLSSKHVFFQWYGRWYKRVLKFPTMYFVQDMESEMLLKNEGVVQVDIAGDTRIDRVTQIVEAESELSRIEEFKNGKPLLILGSSWRTEEQYLAKYLHQLENQWKVIIAPHEVNEKVIKRIMDSLPVPSKRYSRWDSEKNLATDRVLVIDSIGLLSRVYRYADLAIIGGGFIDGIHNILEPSVFGVPSFFGPNYKKFNEANELIKLGGAFSFGSYEEFTTLLSEYTTDIKRREEASQVCSSYIQKNKGASIKIMNRLDEWLAN